tara:strand:+ start:357 stop:1961 length:1605 start_codon:yes stop_codon:yes gene_type:complete
MVLNTNTKRDTGRKAQLGNIQAAKTVSDIIRTTLGPRSMLKMLLDPMGGIVLTNDGNAILREIDVSHPAAKSMIELSRAQDEEVGDGTTSVIILAGEMLVVAKPLLERDMHPTVIVRGFYKALEMALEACKVVSVPVETDSPIMMSMLRSCIGTKFVSRYGDLMCDIAIKAVRNVRDEVGGRTEIDLKRFAKVEKIPGGDLTDCVVIDGVMLNKDVTHARMRRRIENPRVILLDCPLEYKKADSQVAVEVMGEEDWDALLKMEEEAIAKMCNEIIALKPDIVMTEKGCSDLAQHFFVKANITCLRRLRKTDNNRVAKATGATICHETGSLTESDVGTGCGLYEVRKIGDEYFSFVEQCADPKACTILLRGASKDVLNEVERNLQDAMQVARNVMFEPRLCPGGGATEMAVSSALRMYAASVPGMEQWPIRAVAEALEVIPRTLAQNCGGEVVRTVTALRAAHAAPGWRMDGDQLATDGNVNIGINGVTGKLADMADVGIWDTFQVKQQTIKTAVESAAMLLRIDDIVSGIGAKK